MTFSSLRGLCFLAMLPLLLSGMANASPISPGKTDCTAAGHADKFHWVDTWTSMPQLVESSNMPPAPFSGAASTFKDATLRQTVHLSVGGERIRVQIANIFGGSELPITAASLALPVGGKPGSNAIDPATVAALTFDGGKSSVTIPRGQIVYSDPIDYKVVSQSMLTVNLYLKAGQSSSNITGHPGSRTTSWIKSGDHLNAPTLNGTSVVHWYYVNNVEVWAPKTTSALVILGDSITDGRGSTDDSNNRWPDLVLAKMQKAGINDITVNNEAAGGNAVLTGGLGPPLLTRYKRDAIQQKGVKYVFIFEGVNDIGVGASADALISAFKTIIHDCKAAGLNVFGATIAPFGSNTYYSAAHEAARQKVNNWILTSGAYDATVDFATLLADPAKPDTLLAKYNSGDFLHPNVAGYQHLADNFPLGIFKHLEYDLKSAKKN